MKATYDFHVEGETHVAVLDEARRVADAYWGRTPYKMTGVDTDGDYFRQLGGRRPIVRAEVRTQALEAVAS